MASTAHLITDSSAAMAPAMELPSSVMGGMLLAYLIGSIPFGLVLAKFYNVGDLRKVGSGNIGATNMLRAGGKKLAAATLFLDMAKGYIAVVLCSLLVEGALAANILNKQAITFNSNTFLYAFGFYAVAGHVWPIWLKYKGGKGVATALGVMLAFSFPVGLLCMAAWLGVFAVSRYSSFSALVSIGISPFLCFAIIGPGAAISALLIAIVVFYRHKENIQRLLAGSEPKVGEKKPS
jgi:glycerol-3-phosphate acyltransferase PlsY